MVHRTDQSTHKLRGVDRPLGKKRRRVKKQAAPPANTQIIAPGAELPAPRQKKPHELEAEKPEQYVDHEEVVPVLDFDGSQGRGTVRGRIQKQADIAREAEIVERLREVAILAEPKDAAKLLPRALDLAENLKTRYALAEARGYISMLAHKWDAAEAEKVEKRKVYLKPGEHAPPGQSEREGKLGGRYYEVEGREGRHEPTPRIEREGSAPPSVFRLAEDAVDIARKYGWEPQITRIKGFTEVAWAEHYRGRKSVGSGGTPYAHYGYGSGRMGLGPECTREIKQAIDGQVVWSSKYGVQALAHELIHSDRPISMWGYVGANALLEEAITEWLCPDLATAILMDVLQWDEDSSFTSPTSYMDECQSLERIAGVVAGVRWPFKRDRIHDTVMHWKKDIDPDTRADKVRYEVVAAFIHQDYPGIDDDIIKMVAGLNSTHLNWSDFWQGKGIRHRERILEKMGMDVYRAATNLLAERKPKDVPKRGARSKMTPDEIRAKARERVKAWRARLKEEGRKEKRVKKDFGAAPPADAMVGDDVGPMAVGYDRRKERRKKRREGLFDKQEAASGISSENMGPKRILEVPDSACSKGVCEVFANTYGSEILTQAVPQDVNPAYGSVSVLYKADDEEEEHEVVVGGYASPQVIDRERHLISREAMAGDLPRFLAHPKFRNVMLLHSNVQVGEVLPEWTDPKTGKTFRTEVDDIGLFCVIKVRTDEHRPPIVDQVIEDIEEGKLAAFSISGDAPLESREYTCKDGKCFWYISEIIFYEITLCEEGVNQDAKLVILSKSLDVQQHSCPMCAGSVTKAATTLIDIAEGKIHASYTDAMDKLRELGHLDREERIALSDAITVALKAFGDRVKELGLDTRKVPAEDAALIVKALLATGYIKKNERVRFTEQLMEGIAHLNDRDLGLLVNDVFPQESESEGSESKQALREKVEAVAEGAGEEDAIQMLRDVQEAEDKAGSPGGAGPTTTGSMQDFGSSVIERTHARDKCMTCDKPPTVAVEWAEGKARAWFCDEHWEEWKKENPEEPIYWPVEDGAVGKARHYLGEGEEPPEGSEAQEGPRGGRYYEPRAAGLADAVPLLAEAAETTQYPDELEKLTRFLEEYARLARGEASDADVKRLYSFAEQVAQKAPDYLREFASDYGGAYGASAEDWVEGFEEIVGSTLRRARYGDRRSQAIAIDQLISFGHGRERFLTVLFGIGNPNDSAVDAVEDVLDHLAGANKMWRAHLKKGVPVAAPWMDDEILNEVYRYKKFLEAGAEPEEAYDKCIEEAGRDKPWFGTRQDEFGYFLLHLEQDGLPIPDVRLRVDPRESGKEREPDPHWTAPSLLDIWKEALAGWQEQKANVGGKVGGALTYEGVVAPHKPDGEDVVHEVQGRGAVMRAIRKGRVYIPEGQVAPKGVEVQEGPRGGIYYEDDIRGNGEKPAPQKKPSVREAQKTFARILAERGVTEDQLSSISTAWFMKWDGDAGFLLVDRLMGRDAAIDHIKAQKWNFEMTTKKANKYIEALSAEDTWYNRDLQPEALAAVREASQAALKQAGITALPLYRGVSDEMARGLKEGKKYTPRPMASWTTSRKFAGDWAVETSEQGEGAVVSKTIPAEQVFLFSDAVPSLRRFGQHEVVIMRSEGDMLHLAEGTLMEALEPRDQLEDIDQQHHQENVHVKVGAPSYVARARTYVAPGEEPPPGTDVQTGPRGGRYYEAEVRDRLTRAAQKIATSQESYHKEFTYKGDTYKIDVEPWWDHCIADIADVEEWSEEDWDTNAPDIVAEEHQKDIETLERDGYEVLWNDQVEGEAWGRTAILAVKRREEKAEGTATPSKPIAAPSMAGGEGKPFSPEASEDPVQERAEGSGGLGVPQPGGRMKKGRHYLGEGEEAPEGVEVQDGPRGGRYYEPTGAAPAEDFEAIEARIIARLAKDSRQHLARNASWYASLTADETKAIGSYLDMFEFDQINGYLRMGEAMGDMAASELSRTTRALDKLVAKAPPAPPTLWRGVVDKEGWFRGLKEGDDFSDKAFTSTSVSMDSAAMFAGEAGDISDGVLVKIQVPKGTKAAYIDSIRSEGEFDSELEWMQRTNEYLLPRGRSFKVLSWGKPDDDWGIPVLEVELV